MDVVVAVAIVLLMASAVVNMLTYRAQKRLEMQVRPSSRKVVRALIVTGWVAGVSSVSPDVTNEEILHSMPNKRIDIITDELMEVLVPRV